MESLSLKEENIIKDVRNLFRLEKLKDKAINTSIKDIRNLFRIEKENKAIKDRLIRDNKSLLENEQAENYYKSVI